MYQTWPADVNVLVAFWPVGSGKLAPKLRAISIGANPTTALWGSADMARPKRLKTRIERPRRVGFLGRG